MSMKENIDFVKEELNSEEKFLEGFVKVERFYKKYKALIIGLISLLVIFAIAFNVKNYLDGENKIKANEAFSKVLKDSKDTKALEVLKDTNKNLYDLALFINAKKEDKAIDVNVKYLKELSAYQKALTDKNTDQLNTLSMQNDFLLKEFAIFNKALILAQEGKYKEAKVALNLIPQTSKAYELSKLLRHYLLTK